MSFGDYGTAERFRKLMVRLARSQINILRPPPRYGIVESISLGTQTCYVLFGNDPEPVEVGIAGNAPVVAGQVVRVEGVPGDRYVTDVVSVGNSTQLSARPIPYGGGAVVTIPAKPETDAPSTYPFGLSMMSLSTGSGVGTYNGISSGTIINDHINNSRFIQWAMGATSGRIYFRYGHPSAVGGVVAGWGPWSEFHHTGRNHTNDHFIAARANESGYNFDLNASVTAIDELEIIIPSDWGTWEYFLDATAQIGNSNAAGTAASATIRTLALRFGRNGSVVGPNRQHTLRNVTHELLTLHMSNTIGAGNTGSNLFQINGSLNTADNYKVTTLAWSVQAFRTS